MNNYSIFISSISKLLLGSGLAQAITIFTTIIIARFYSPINFSEYGVYIATISIFLTFATAKLELALIQVSTYPEYKKILNSAIFVLIASALIFITFTTQIYSLWLKDGALIFIFLGMIAHGLTLIYSNLFSSQERYFEIGLFRIFGALTFAIISISLGYNDIQTTVGLIIAALASQSIMALLYMAFGKVPLTIIPISEIKLILHEYRDYWSLATISSLLNTFARQLPVILFPVIFSPVIAGYYFFSQRIVAAPVNLLANSVGNVFRKSATREYVEFGHFREIFIFTLSRLFLIVLIVSVFIFLVIDENIISFIFGAEWVGVLFILKMMIVFYAFKLVISPLTYSLYVVRKLDWNLYAQIFYLICLLLPIVIGWYFGFDANLIITLHVLGACFAYLHYLLISYYCAKKGRKL